MRGGEEEVKIFIDTHIHLVQIYTRVLNTEQGCRKHKWVLLFLRFIKSDVRGKRIYSPQFTYLSSSLFAPGRRTGMVSAELITTSKALPLHETSGLQKANVSHAPERQMATSSWQLGNSGWDACFPNRAGTPACPVVAAACQGQPRPCQWCCLRAAAPNPSRRACTQGCSFFGTQTPNTASSISCNSSLGHCGCEYPRWYILPSVLLLC